jgi:ligand-binding sensor domain-containing protein
VYQDKQQQYWFGSNGEGVYRYDGKTIINYTTRDGLCSDSIRQIQEDRFGNMYFSTLSGINKFDGTSISTLHPIKSKQWKLEPDDMWFYIIGKKNEHGPYRYDGKQLYQYEFPRHYLHDEMYAKGINPFFSPYEIYSIYKDRSDALWFGTSVFGACRFDGKRIKWMYEKDLTLTPAGGSFGIRSIFEDREGNFWLCNTWHRFKLDKAKTDQSDRLQYEKVEGIGYEDVFGGDKYIYYSHIVEDNQGMIWLCTWDQGIYRYNPFVDKSNANSIIHYPVQDKGKDVQVVSLYKDQQGSVWLGTPDNGVFKLQGTTFERFSP